MKNYEICNQELANEKNFLLYDDSYFGEGYFVVTTRNGKITKFLKLYIMDNTFYPNYGLRAFSVDGKDNLNEEFNQIEFIFRSREDLDNGLFDAFSSFSKSTSKEIYTIDGLQQGRNNISISANNEHIKLIVSKDIYRGKQHPTDFIDINFGDNYSCKNYEAINNLYNTFIKNCHQIATQKDIKKLMMLKINKN